MGVRLLSPTSGYPARGLALEEEPPEHLAVMAYRAYLQELYRAGEKQKLCLWRVYIRFHMLWDSRKNHKSRGQTYLWILEDS